MCELELQHTAACRSGSVPVCLLVRSQLLQTALEEQCVTRAFMAYVLICSGFILVDATQFGGHIQTKLSAVGEHSSFLSVNLRSKAAGMCFKAWAGGNL